MTKVVGLTGNVAAGKSSVTALLAEWGASIIDADAIVRTLQQPGEPVFAAIVERFGPGIVDQAGQLDRAALRRAILADPAAKQDLESIVHPAVYERIRHLIDAARHADESLVIVDIPLLFETGDPAEYDAVILVDAPVEERRRRLMELRGLGAGEADALLASQQPSDLKRRAADFVIDNDGDLDTLTARTRDVWEAVLAS